MKTEDKDSYLDELDRLVETELQSLVTHVRQHFSKSRSKGEEHPATRTDRTERHQTGGNVVQAHPLARRPRRPKRPPQDLFASEEAAFLADAVDWLHGRPNADILIEALRREVLDRQSEKANATPDPAPETNSRAGYDKGQSRDRTDHDRQSCEVPASAGQVEHDAAARGSGGATDNDPDADCGDGPLPDGQTGRPDAPRTSSP